MTEQQLDGAHVGAGFEQMVGEGVAQRWGVIGLVRAVSHELRRRRQAGKGLGAPARSLNGMPLAVTRASQAAPTFFGGGQATRATAAHRQSLDPEDRKSTRLNSSHHSISY